MNTATDSAHTTVRDCSFNRSSLHNIRQSSQQHVQYTVSLLAFFIYPKIMVNSWTVMPPLPPLRGNAIR